MTRKSTLARTLAVTLKARGISRAFGVPGSGACLDVMAATHDEGIDFVLTQSENAAAIMAAVTAELSGAPGVVITGLGPGVMSAVNGIAYAALERSPMVLLSDCIDDGAEPWVTYQRIDQGAVYAPLAKAYGRLRAEDGAAAIEALLDTALAHPRGPVHMDLGAAQAVAQVTGAAPAAAGRQLAMPDEDDMAAARALLSDCRRPVIIAGIEARDDGAGEALGTLAEGLDCPVLFTYKAKGVISDEETRAVGLFTGATVEADCLQRADLIIFYGLDPVEIIPQPWRYTAPVLNMSLASRRLPVEPAAAMIGPLARCAEALRGGARKSAWTAAEMVSLGDTYRRRVAIPESSSAPAGRSAQAVVEAVAAAKPSEVRVTIDSGAHMFSAMTFLDARAPGDVLTSNGLSTMAYALPAAIAAALHEPGRGAVALTGDGGMMMCLSELATAQRLGCRIAVVVFNDAALSLVDIKQCKRGLRRHGVRYPRIDMAAAARALGCRAWSVGGDDALTPVLAEALAGDGPALIDVTVDPSGYAAQFDALRG
ncbi:MAG: thiamine pyrophosphate-dependent enzyme [Rhodospirillales bacterium]|jgi:acetolactate synthase-1/2/3 large subunit|nr:thiamine pyrophosphate-dependent enzyme [Rhodospirillales bacterium]